MGETIKLILEHLDALFRYVLSGFVVLGVAYSAHPSWFGWYRPAETSSLLQLAALSVIVGPLAYCLHRFSIHQLLDYICWKWLNNIGVKYRAALKAALEKGVAKDKIDDHIAVRSSQLILLFIAIESAVAFAILSPEDGSLLFHVIQHYGYFFTAGALASLFFAVSQYSLVNELDRTLDRPNR